MHDITTTCEIRSRDFPCKELQYKHPPDELSKSFEFCAAMSDPTGGNSGGDSMGPNIHNL